MTTPTLASTASVLDAEALRMLAAKTGPCITIVIPDRHPGAPEGSQRALLRRHLQSAQRQLRAGSLAFFAETLLARLEEIGLDPALKSGGPGWAIFRMPAFVACYRAHTGMDTLSIASHPLLAPFVRDALAAPDSVVLGLNSKCLRLFECSRDDCREVELPPDVPLNAEAAGKFGHATRAVENRSMYGSPLGHSGVVRFGTATDRENKDAFLHDFFEVVHRGISPILAGRPLVLMGVQTEIAAYRRAAKGGEELLAGDPANAAILTPSEIGAMAREAVLAHDMARAEAVLAKLKEIRDRSHVSMVAEDVLRAAGAGRVHHLCAREGTPLMGRMEPELDRIRADKEDLVNAAIVETLRTGGTVHMLPQDSMAGTEPLAAILRY
ncbi:MAG: hypothetical protein ABI972_04070 [Acidobacteriota bacterium]